MSLFGGSSTGLSREQKIGVAANAGVSDSFGIYGDYYSEDQRRRNQAMDAIKLYGVQGGYGTGTRNISGGTNPGLFSNPWGPGTFTDSGLTSGSVTGDYYDSDSPDIQTSKLRKMLSPNDWNKILPRLQSGSEADRRWTLDAYLKQSGFSSGLSAFSDEAVAAFLKDPYITSTVPGDISVKNFAKSGTANKVWGTQEKLLDPKGYFDYVMKSPAAQNMTRYVSEATDLMKREGPLYDSWMRTAEKGQKERQSIQMRETQKELERLRGRSPTASNQAKIAALEATAARELSATYARDWDEFLMDFTQRSQEMYTNAIAFSNNWVNDLAEFRSSTLAARDNLLNYRTKQLELQYRQNENWINMNPKQDSGAALTMIGGIMSVIGTALSFTPLAPVGVGLSVAGSVATTMGGGQPDSGMLNTALGAASNRGLFGGGTQFSMGNNKVGDWAFNKDGGLKISGGPWR